MSLRTGGRSAFFSYKVSGKVYHELIWLLTAAAMQDENPLHVLLTIAAAHRIVLCIHQSIRHPEMDALMRGRLTELGRQFQGSVVEMHPEAAEPLEMGWHEHYDVDWDE